MREGSLAHTKRDRARHMAFIPEYRGKVLYGECRAEIKEIIKRLLEMYKLEVVEGAVSKVMGMLKGKSAMALLDRRPEWRRRTGQDVLGERIFRLDGRQK